MKYYILMKMNYSYIKQMEKVKNILLDKRTKKKRLAILKILYIKCSIIDTVKLYTVLRVYTLLVKP